MATIALATLKIAASSWTAPLVEASFSTVQKVWLGIPRPTDATGPTKYPTVILKVLSLFFHVKLQVLTVTISAFLGFKCPPTAKGYYGEEYRYFRSPNDCQRYFVCIEGSPRMYNCGEGRAYNEITSVCDGAENVTGCEPPYNANYDQKNNLQPQFFRG